MNSLHSYVHNILLSPVSITSFFYSFDTGKFESIVTLDKCIIRSVTLVDVEYRKAVVSSQLGVFLHTDYPQHQPSTVNIVKKYHSAMKK